jgi:hypothetical protein
MAQFTSLADGDTGIIFGDEGFLESEDELNKLALDGVSCTVCHQVQADGLGTAASFSGGFSIDTILRRPERLLYGPYKSSEQNATVMAGASGYIPEQGLHITGSELCATCHTLFTPYVDETGAIAGEFAEQTPYFEWYYSDYRSSQNCQDCHMPEAEGGVSIATTSQILRSPFAKHNFVGGNVYMLTILDRFGDELGVTASSEHFQATIERTLDQMQKNTANLTVDEARLSGGRVMKVVRSYLNRAVSTRMAPSLAMTMISTRTCMSSITRPSCRRSRYRSTRRSCVTVREKSQQRCCVPPVISRITACSRPGSIRVHPMMTLWCAAGPLKISILMKPSTRFST